MNRGESCACLLLVLLLCLASHVEGQAVSPPPARFPESRSFSPGKTWLAWSPSERSGFVRGFIVGHEEGYRQACTISEAGSRATLPTGFDPCLEKRHLFKRDLSHYEQFITDFYRQYAEDRDVPLQVLLLQADERTPKEVHDWLAKKE